MNYNKPANFSNYSSLSNYNKNVLGIPFGKTDYKKVVPSWSNISYTNPNYDELTDRSGNNYTSITQAYSDATVKYADIPCRKN